MEETPMEDKFKTWLEERIKMLKKEADNRSHGDETRAGIGQKVGEAMLILEKYDNIQSQKTPKTPHPYSPITHLMR
jgi:hypothetical protein